MMDITAALTHLGHFGKYQFYVYSVSLIPEIIGGIIMLSSVFISGTPKYRCRIDKCDHISQPQYDVPFLNFTIPKIDTEYSECKEYSINKLGSEFYGRNNNSDICDRKWFSNNITQFCNSWVYDNSEYVTTAVTEWNLVCDNSWKLPLSQSVFMTGVMIGAFVFGYFADRYGRRTVFFIAPIIAVSSCIATGLSTNFIVFTISSAITASAVTGMFQTGFVIGIEFISMKWRLWCANLQQCAFAFGELILCLLAYYIREWHTLQYVIAIIILPTVLLPFLLPESVRWQMSHGQSYNAIMTINRAAKMNGVIIPNDLIYISDESFLNNNLNQNNVKSHGPLDLFRYRTLRRWTINLFFNWIINSLVYYGISLQASEFGSNTYETFALLSFVEIPGIIIATFALKFFGRRTMLIVLMAIGGCACIAPSFIPKEFSSFIAILAIIGKANISASFALIYIYSVEIFPTVLRTTGLGMCSMFSRFGGILAPHLIELKFLGENVPLLLSGIASLIAAALAFDLPETMNKRLPETIDDVEILLKNAKSRGNLLNPFGEASDRSEGKKLISDDHDESE